MVTPPRETRSCRYLRYKPILVLRRRCRHGRRGHGAGTPPKKYAAIDDDNDHHHCRRKPRARRERRWKVTGHLQDRFDRCTGEDWLARRGRARFVPSRTQPPRPSAPPSVGGRVGINAQHARRGVVPVTPPAIDFPARESNSCAWATRLRPNTLSSAVVYNHPFCARHTVAHEAREWRIYPPSPDRPPSNLVGVTRRFGARSRNS